MKKKLVNILLISLCLLVMFSFAVEAGKFTETLSKAGKFLFEDLPTMGDYGFKFLMSIILFALINYALTVKDTFDKRTAGIIALVVSLSTVILMPGGIIKHVFGLYGIILILGLGIFIPALLFWWVHSQFTGDSLGENLIRAAIYAVIGYALYNFASYAGTLMEAAG